nr:PREDICTED: uncharacterized protein C21orf58 homolog isoform X2 [Latimeria chalumnae]|eukprot:XP_014344931.1 PREDICTED: uncharacterized protein C21orf58 homolog isoform X2 [Latimeria chalumnae]
MADPALVDQMTRLKLKLLEKKIENERENMEDRSETAMSSARSYDGHEDALHSALRRRKDLLQKLREQHVLEELARPHTWGGTRRKHHRLESIQQAPPINIYQPPPPPPPPEPPRIIQHTMPQQPATIIQQLPQQQPLITQIPPLQALPPIRSGSIKEDMVELMLMQNAQMHQIIMHNMMLKALPPVAFSQPGALMGPPTTQQDVHVASPVVLRSEKPRPSSVHHHHHYSSTGMQQTLPQAPLPPIGYPMWPPMMSSNPMGQTGGFPPSIHHMTGQPTALPALQTETG